MAPRTTTDAPHAARAGEERAFGFLRTNPRDPKPRERGLTEIRGPYYSAFGPRCVHDLLDAFGEHVDSLKFAGGSFALMPRRVLRDVIDACHAHDVRVSTGGVLERVLLDGPDAVDLYLEECRDLGFDVVEVSRGFLAVSPDDFLALVARVRDAGLEPKPEVGVQFGAGGATEPDALEAAGGRDVEAALDLARRALDSGARVVMLESEGVTENVSQWRADVVQRFASGLGLDRVMFEAADPRVFQWLVRKYGPDVNLFVDHSQVAELECLREGLWGTHDIWGRVRAYKP